MSDSKCCAVTWLLLIAAAMWITGLTIGIIGAVNYAPLKPFLDNSQKSTCTLVEPEYRSKRCVKWGNCLIVTWESTYPSFADPDVTATAWIVEKGGLGYNDASKLAATRKAGDAVPCLIDKRTGRDGYFNRPGDGFLAELIIGWIFFFLGTFVWIIFFMEVCCGIKLSKMLKRCSCSCDCSSGKSSSPYRAGTSPATATNISNPLYANSTTAPARYSNSSRNSMSSSSKSVPEEELTPMPPVGAVPPTAEPYVTPYVPGGAGRVVSSSSSSARSSVDSSSDDNYGAGAGFEN